MALYTTPVFNINLKKLAANYRLLEKLSAPAIPAAVVKDDAYGLGAAEVAAALYAAGCRRFFDCPWFGRRKNPPSRTRCRK